MWPYVALVISVQTCCSTAVVMVILETTFTYHVKGVTMIVLRDKSGKKLH
jgi:hypothetical protein